MKLTKSQREALRMKFGGLCAYCGAPLSERWHADHFQPVIRGREYVKGKGFTGNGSVDWPERDCLENLMPACAPCNIDKSCQTLEEWRKKLTHSAGVLWRNQSTYRHAVRFGLVRETGAAVVFHFEREEQGIPNLATIRGDLVTICPELVTIRKVNGNDRQK